MPAEKSMANQLIQENSGSSSSRPSLMLPKREKHMYRANTMKAAMTVM